MELIRDNAVVAALEPRKERPILYRSIYPLHFGVAVVRLGEHRLQELAEVLLLALAVGVCGVVCKLIRLFGENVLILLGCGLSDIAF